MVVEVAAREAGATMVGVAAISAAEFPMQNKSKKFTDVQLIISSISIALTLGFWSLFASREKTGASVIGEVQMPNQPDALAVTTASTTLLPGQKIIFSGTVPQQQPQPTTAPTSTSRRGRGGGGGGGGGHASTGSSH